MHPFLATPGPPLPPKTKPEQAVKIAKAVARGQREGPQFALTAFRDKLSEKLGEREDKGLIERLAGGITNR